MTACDCDAFLEITPGSIHRIRSRLPHGARLCSSLPPNREDRPRSATLICYTPRRYNPEIPMAFCTRPVHCSTVVLIFGSTRTALPPGPGASSRAEGLVCGIES